MNRKNKYLDQNKHSRKSMRLIDYDYGSPGAYLVTICVFNRHCIFGEITEGKMVLNDFGKIVMEEWKRSSGIRQEIELDEFIVMPNHIHGIVIIRSDERATGRSPLRESQPIKPKGPASKSLGAFVAGFKSVVTRRINRLLGKPGSPLWQRSYYEHVIRNTDDLNLAREYIINNPLRWAIDKEKPDGKKQ